MPTAHPASPSTALRILLRSIGQIVLQANAFTGAMLIGALALTNLRLAGAALAGAAVANLTAALSGAAHCHVEQGRHGFNGALAALAAVSFAPAPLAALALALAPSAALGAALVQRALRTPLAKWRQCPYSGPYIAVTALWMPLVAVQHPIDAATSATLTPASIACALSSGIAQTTFAQGAWPAALIVAGIGAASRRAVAFALGGAIVSSVLLVAFGASGAAFDAGQLGVNGALAALALMSRGTRTALAAAALAALLQWLAMRAGLVALTAPFALASWVTVAVARRLSLGETDIVVRTPS